MPICPACREPIAHHDHERALNCLLILAVLKPLPVEDVMGPIVTGCLGE